ESLSAFCLSATLSFGTAKVSTFFCFANFIFFLFSKAYFFFFFPASSLLFFPRLRAAKMRLFLIPVKCYFHLFSDYFYSLYFQKTTPFF
ncbi:hypothetical protein, partial [Mucilaginibacter gotjawali]|uniref:hypothetical protein n=1 Tax=Mucilaginibacter gotjawali TaxID=1550579 RepID=UPI001C84DE1B